MGKGKSIVALVPARGGSKSVANKNIYPLRGKPLISYTIESALQVEEIDRVIVSTDSDTIGYIAVGCGAEYYKRPPHLASDTSLVVDTIRYVHKILIDEGENPDIFLLLEPTCPLRMREDISDCISLLKDKNYDSVATFKEADLNPIRAWKIDNDSPAPFIRDADPWQPRQRLPPAYQLNGAVYAFYIERLPVNGNSLLFGRSGAVIIPKARSVDIDDHLDFLIVESIMEYYKNGK
jgi:CMP-N,N'-diacetyllegionaminic acid synthase